jgi:molybdenum cofactor cytidylyltransferase
LLKDIFNMISAIVLGAGKAEKTSKPKLFLPLRGKAVLQWVLESVLASAVSEVICVVRDLVAVRAHISISDERLFWLVNDRAELGQSSSVIAGLWAVNARSQGALLVAGDQPMPNHALIDALIERFKKASPPAVAPTCKGEIREPVLFSRELFPELLRLEGDSGAREVIKKHRHGAQLVEWKEEASFMEVSDEKDYQGIKQLA